MHTPDPCPKKRNCKVNAMHPLRVGIDIAQTPSRQCFTFHCHQCEATRHTATPAIPADWQLNMFDDIDAGVLLCADCLTALEAKQAPASPAFAVFLEKQPGDHFDIAMLPDSVMMRWHPLGFFLSPDQARETAAQLIQYATLAENPGSIPAGKGGAK